MTQPLEVYSLLSACCTGLVLNRITHRFFNIRQGFKFSSIFIQFLTIIIFSTFILTVLHSYASIIFLVLLTVAVHFYSNEVTTSTDRKTEPSITLFRSYCSFLTIISILAIDFPSVYPERFGKSEKYGASVMDTGVGILVFGSGASFGLSKRNKMKISDLITTSACLGLGVVRFISIRIFGLNETVEEYGVHWNFFLTIAVINIISNSLLRGRSSTFLSFTGVGIIFAYQICLEKGLRDYIFNAERTTLFSKNREGILSCLGYISIFCLSAVLSRIVNSKNMLSKLLTATVIFSLAYYKLYAYELPSRRMANLTYVSWMLSCCSYFWWLLKFLNDSCGFVSTGVPVLLEKINNHGFGAFLVGNILTGIVNLTTNSREVGVFGAMTILFGYMAIVSLYAIFAQVLQ